MSSTNIDFRYRSIEIDKEKSCDFDQYNGFVIQIDDELFMFIFGEVLGSKSR